MLLCFKLASKSTKLGWVKIMCEHTHSSVVCCEYQTSQNLKQLSVWSSWVCFSSCFSFISYSKAIFWWKQTEVINIWAVIALFLSTAATYEAVLIKTLVGIQPKVARLDIGKRVSHTAFLQGCLLPASEHLKMRSPSSHLLSYLSLFPADYCSQKSQHGTFVNAGKYKLSFWGGEEWSGAYNTARFRSSKYMNHFPTGKLPVTFCHCLGSCEQTLSST